RLGRELAGAGAVTARRGVLAGPRCGRAGGGAAVAAGAAARVRRADVARAFATRGDLAGGGGCAGVRVAGAAVRNAQLTRAVAGAITPRRALRVCRAASRAVGAQAVAQEARAPARRPRGLRREDARAGPVASGEGVLARAGR